MIIYIWIKVFGSPCNEFIKVVTSTCKKINNAGIATKDG